MVRRCAECFYNMGNCGDGTIKCDVLTDLLKNRTDEHNKDNQMLYRFLVDELNLIGDVFYDEGRDAFALTKMVIVKTGHQNIDKLK